MTDTKVHRRSFLHGAITSSAAVGLGAGCTRRLPPPTLDPGDVALWMQRLQRSADAIEQSPILAEVMLPPRDERELADWESADEDIRGCLRSLYVSGAFLDLPPHARAHPTIHNWVQAQMPAIEARGEQLLALLEESTPEERSAVRQELEDAPELIPRFAEVVDDRAQYGGLRAERRHQTREIFRIVDWRLRSQPASLLIDEYTVKARRAQGWRGFGAPQPPPGAVPPAPGTSAPAPSEWSAGAVPPPPPAYGTGASPTPGGMEPTSEAQRETERLQQIEALRSGARLRRRAGGWMLGLGVPIGAVGGGLVAADPDVGALFVTGNVMITHGVVLFVLGIIFTIASLRRRHRLRKMGAEG